MAVKILVDNKMREEVSIEYEKRSDSNFRGENSVSADYKRDMILLACVGEIAFQKYCEIHNLNMSFSKKAFSGRSIKVGKDIIEVKTSGYFKTYDRLNFMYNVQQYNDNKDKGITKVVQVFANGYDYVTKTFNLQQCTEVDITSFILFDDIPKLETKLSANMNRTAFVCSLDNLTNINR